MLACYCVSKGMRREGFIAFITLNKNNKKKCGQKYIYCFYDLILNINAF